jgi:hypothetical protein
LRGSEFDSEVCHGFFFISANRRLASTIFL